MFRYLPLVFKNALRNRRRSVLTVGSIGVSLCLLGVMMALYRVMFLAGPQTPAQAKRAVVHHRVSITQPLPMSYEQQIAAVHGVAGITTWQWFGGRYKDDRDQRNFFAQFAVDPGAIPTVLPEVSMPQDEMKAFQTERTACIVGRSLADKFGWKVGDRITILGDIFPVDLEFKIAGIFTNPDNEDVLFFNREYLRQALIAKNTGQSLGMADTSGAYLLIADSPADVSGISQAIDKMYDNSPAPTKTESEQAFALSFASMLGNLKLFLAAIACAITFTILLVCANTISMSVRERVREVGILKTLGYTRGTILGLILGEAAVISLIGGAVGLLLASGLCMLVRQGPAFIAGIKTLALTPDVIGVSLAVAVFIGVASSFAPAWNASRTTILDALRYSG